MARGFFVTFKNGRLLMRREDDPGPRCYYAEGVLIPGCMGAAVYGEEGCT